MSTHAIVAAEIGGKTEGRYVHLDGYPTGIGRALARIIKRDGLERAIQTLLLDHADWSFVNDAADPVENPWGTTVKGYGIANVSGLVADGGEWYEVGDGVDERVGAHWAYVIGAENIDVFRSIGNRWQWYDGVSHEWMLAHDITKEGRKL